MVSCSSLIQVFKKKKFLSVMFVVFLIIFVISMQLLSKFTWPRTGYEMQITNLTLKPKLGATLKKLSAQ